MNHQHSVEYTDYMQSRQWQERKCRLFNKRGYVCEKCGSAGIPLEVHHKNYDRLGHELDDDLLIVCAGKCHARADCERVEWEARRQYQREHPIRWRTLEEIELLTVTLFDKRTERKQEAQA